MMYHTLRWFNYEFLLRLLGDYHSSKEHAPHAIEFGPAVEDDVQFRFANTKRRVGQK